MDIEDPIESDKSPEMSRQPAGRDFGSVALAAGRTRNVWGWTAAEQIVQDVRHAWRSALRNPGFTSAAAFTLALAIGATTTIAGFVYAAHLHPLPFADPDRIVRLFESPRNPASGPSVLDWQTQTHVFEALAALRQAPRTIETAQGMEQIGGMQVSAGFFPLLGVNLLHGRDFLPEEDRASGERVVILSHGLWQRRFAGDVGAIGASLTLNGQPFTVIGVLPRDFRFTAREIGLWMPLRLGDESHWMQRSERYLQVIARLRPGITPSQADMELDALARRIALESGRSSQGVGVDVVELQEDMVGSLRQASLVLLAASACVLLIGCSNLINLLLARSLARGKELTIRVALGAGRLRVVRQLVMESLLIGLLGGAAGTLLAIWAMAAALPLLTRMGGSYAFAAARMSDTAGDGRVLGVGLALSLVAAVFSALLSATYATGTDLRDALQRAGKGTIGNRRGTRLRSALVVAEISLTFLLLAGAGLLINSFWRLRQTDLGFDPSGILTMRLHSSPPEAIDFYRDVLEKARALPAVESASVVSSLPLLGADLTSAFTIEQRPVPAGKERPRAVYKIVAGEYFETMRIPLAEGRYFDSQDGEGREPVVVINQAMAREHWPGESPVGRRIQRGGPERPWIRIVGVVRDVKVSGPDTATPSEMYFPHSQFLLRANSRMAIPEMTLVVRSGLEPGQAIPLLRAQIRAVNQRALISTIEPMEEAFSRVVAPHELTTLLLSAFAAVALTLAVLGLYGVTSYSVARRSQEIGLRMALGADRREVMGMVIRSGGLLVALGVTIGLVGAVGLTRWMSALLFEVDSLDPLTLGTMMAVVVVVSLAACYIPARRAAGVDPLIALRTE